MAFIQDPRLRQRWNQLSHTTEAVTSDAAAGIWTFGHRYVTPCLASLADAVDSCAGAVCLGGNREERARRARERDRGARRTRVGAGVARGAEYSFDFYDDWEEDLAEEFAAAAAADGEDDEDGYAGGGGGGSGGSRRGLLGGWGGRGEDWDRLLAGTGVGGHHRARHGHGAADGDVVDQPRRKRGMSYGTRGGVRRKVSGEEDPNVIPRTAPLGFLGRLPFKIVGSLRYKPSAANLREHPGGIGTSGGQGYHADGEEQQPLLGEDGAQRPRSSPQQGSRPRSDTTTSGDTSSSYRSRGDLFPSDGEGDEDAVPLDDEFTVALERVDDRSSNKTRSSKGKRPADRDRDRDKGLSRTVSRSTLSSANTTPAESRGDSIPVSPLEGLAPVPSLEDLQREEQQVEREEHEEIERRRRAAAQLAIQKGLSKESEPPDAPETVDAETKGVSRLPPPPLAEVSTPEADVVVLDQDDHEAVDEPKPAPPAAPPDLPPAGAKKEGAQPRGDGDCTFVPARLPHFG